MATILSCRGGIYRKIFGSSGIRFSWEGLDGGDRAYFARCGFFAAMNDTEHHWHEHECCAGGENQAANDRAPEWRILFAAFAQPERHWRHADDHGQRRH